MPERPVSPEQLQRVLDGAESPADPDLRSLAAVATGLARLAPDGPDAAATLRLRAVFAARLERRPPPPLVRWLGRWLGFGPAPRPLVERLAAGVLVIAIAGGGASAATGANPLTGAADLLRSVVLNLDPRGGEGTGPLGSPTPSPTGTAAAEPSPGPSAPPSAAPSATATPSPAGPRTRTRPDRGTPSPSSTPDDEHEKEDESDDDSSGRSRNSGRGSDDSRTPDDSEDDE